MHVHTATRRATLICQISSTEFEPNIKQIELNINWDILTDKGSSSCRPLYLGYNFGQTCMGFYNDLLYMRILQFPFGESCQMTGYGYK